MVVLEAVLIGARQPGRSASSSGFALSLVLIYVINVQSFGWTIQFHVPGGVPGPVVGRCCSWRRRSPGLYPARARRAQVADGAAKNERATHVGRGRPARIASPCRAWTALARLGASQARAARRVADAPTRRTAFAFPRDHASHPDYQIEWWYYTGNVATQDGPALRLPGDVLPRRRRPGAGESVTLGRARPVHDPRRRQRHRRRAVPRTPSGSTRGGPGLAGAATDRYRVWNEDWSRRSTPTGPARAAARRRSATLGVDLVLDEGKPPVVNGEHGISQKGERSRATPRTTTR